MVCLYSYSPPLLLSLLFAAFIFSQRLSAAATTDDFRYTICSQSFECGAIRDVAYPFWGGNRAEYCGLPGLKLEECEFAAPRLTMVSGGQFRVLKLDSNRRTMTIAREDFMNGVCLTKFHNTAMSIPNIFHYADGILNLTLYYNCSISRYSILSGLNCTINGGDDDDSSTSETLFNLAVPDDRCEFNFTIPIEKRFARELQEGKTTLVDAINCGFGLVWDEGLGNECGSCVESGGVCGYNRTDSRFACFCRDQPYPATCPSGQANAKGFHGAKRTAVIVIAPILLAALLLIFVRYCLCRKLSKNRELAGRPNHPTKSLLHLATTQKNNVQIDEYEGSKRKTDLPFFSLRQMKSATDDFSSKIGQGGFGAVYKGQLSSGQEIAVKRLSKHSGQGVEEFKNEVLLIAKLQHRNLVKIMGCCMEEEELMLIYEYMPNKSLDYYIFDQSKKLLDWKMLYKIIIGIARGILYLHQDSRLRIVHRDLKTSNILLDGEMNPRISDFGMARIFGGNQTQANTKRVVGTYGYMSPEYALDGLFSMKSDVFSFGVILLEIVTGKKNHALYNDDPLSNLIRYIWNLWRDGRALEIVDASVGDSRQDSEILRCIQVGLLCVQGIAKDRPSMSTVVFMLSNEVTLPIPRKPAFVIKRTNRENVSPKANESSSSSKNEVTMTVVEPR